MKDSRQPGTFVTVGTALVVPVCFVGMIVFSTSPLGWPFAIVFFGWFVWLWFKGNNG